jgi:sterol carrier protein 2
MYVVLSASGLKTCKRVMVFVFFRYVGLNYTNAGVDPDDFKASVLFKSLEAAMQSDEDNLIERVRGVYGFKVRNGPNGKEGYWIINAKTGKGSVEFNGKGM